ncbi:hypothetical protein [Pseudobacteroides cellulosolvens]|uniref:Uncharacterized protein n=1 Tax=Pseudobacteroides cellulosolvens ATCC 35603 = DSM 2933 TaxID=398512 RepID=A0A0L6JME4_9FIRM|nr:hypothetical protein [Pseudobacteroides cellulosolvens]KNY26944.1 hypothetical protein Bccel_2209 [Pseudobacteroides cellulosolvens ATCC 35603 = DSM 2933]
MSCTIVYQYPEGHPCRGCPFILELTKPSCMFPQTGDKCFMQKELEKNKNKMKSMNLNNAVLNGR